MDEESLAVAMKVLMKARDSEVQEARLSHAKEMAAKKAEFHDIILKRDQEGIQIDVCSLSSTGDFTLRYISLKTKQRICELKTLLKSKDEEIQRLRDGKALKKLDRATANSSTKYYSIPRNKRTDREWKKLLRKVSNWSLLLTAVEPYSFSFRFWKWTNILQPVKTK